MPRQVTSSPDILERSLIELIRHCNPDEVRDAVDHVDRSSDQALGSEIFWAASAATLAYEVAALLVRTRTWDFFLSFLLQQHCQHSDRLCAALDAAAAAAAERAGRGDFDLGQGDPSVHSDLRLLHGMVSRAIRRTGLTHAELAKRAALSSDFIDRIVQGFDPPVQPESGATAEDDIRYYKLAQALDIDTAMLTELARRAQVRRRRIEKALPRVLPGLPPRVQEALLARIRDCFTRGGLHVLEAEIATLPAARAAGRQVGPQAAQGIRAAALGGSQESEAARPGLSWLIEQCAEALAGEAEGGASHLELAVSLLGLGDRDSSATWQWLGLEGQT